MADRKHWCVSLMRLVVRMCCEHISISLQQSSLTALKEEPSCSLLCVGCGKAAHIGSALLIEQRQEAHRPVEKKL